MTSKGKKNAAKKQPRPESPSDLKNQGPSIKTGPRAAPYQKPVAKTSQHPSKRTKVGPEETMDVDSLLSLKKRPKPRKLLFLWILLRKLLRFLHPRTRSKTI